MSISGVNGALTGAYQYSGASRGAYSERAGFAEQLQKARDSAYSSNEEAYRAYLEQRYGTVTIQNVGKDQRSIDSIGLSTSGYNNVVIAPNILEQMANDPEKAAYYESKIQKGLDNFPTVQAQLSALGHEIHSYGVYIDSDGTVYTYTCGDLKPEVRAKIEAQIKAEQEAKLNRRKKYLELGQEAAEKRKTESEAAFKRQTLAELRISQAEKAGGAAYSEKIGLTDYTAAVSGTDFITVSDILA